MKSIIPILLLILILCLPACKPVLECCVSPPDLGSISISVKDIEGNDLLDPTTDYSFQWENITVYKVGEEEEDTTLRSEKFQFNYSQEKGIYELMIDVSYYSRLIILSWNETESDTLWQKYNGENYAVKWELYLNAELQESTEYVEIVKPHP
jgi:hypothetical protein